MGDTHLGRARFSSIFNKHKTNGKEDDEQEKNLPEKMLNLTLKTLFTNQNIFIQSQHGPYSSRAHRQTEHALNVSLQSQHDTI